MMSTQVKVSSLPQCNFGPEQAEYDFKTVFGPWAYGCREHYEALRQFPELGTGKGQKLIVEGK